LLDVVTYRRLVRAALDTPISMGETRMASPQKVLCLGSLAAGICAASVSSCADSRIPTDGLRVDLGATSTQVAQSFAEEMPFLDLAREVPSHGGFYRDTASGNVVVYLKDIAHADRARSLLRHLVGPSLARPGFARRGREIVVREAKYTFLELKAWRDRLTPLIMAAPGVVSLDLDEVDNRIVIGLDFGVGQGLLRRIVGDVGIPQEAVEFETVGPIVLHQQTLLDSIRPFEGGLVIRRLSSGLIHECTLGVNALRNGQRVFVTNAHCSPSWGQTDGVQQYQPRVPITASDSAVIFPIGHEIADTSSACGNRRCSNSDAAIYLATGNPDNWVLGRIAATIYGCFGPCSGGAPLTIDSSRPHFVINATNFSIMAGDLVSKMGSKTGWTQGYVTDTCQVVRSGANLVYCQDFANYASDLGDSGAPVILDIGLYPDSLVTLGGLHSAKAQGGKSVFSPLSGIWVDYGSLIVH